MTSSLPNSPAPQVPEASDPASFYQNPTSPPPQAPEQPSQNPYQSPPPPQVPLKPQRLSSSFSVTPQQSQNVFTSPVVSQQQYQQQNVSSQPPQQQYSSTSHQNPYAQAPGPPPQQQLSSQGPFRDDEDSIMAATKHAKWAISALNFEDSTTAVKELRAALQALGAA